MRVVLQRVSRAELSVDEAKKAFIGSGALLLVGVEERDIGVDYKKLVEKILSLRIFPAIDGSSSFDRSIREVQGELLIVSQFTLFADIRKGRRPSFNRALSPDVAKKEFERVVKQFKESYEADKVFQGVFGAYMEVTLCNDGPVTLVIDYPW